MANILDEIWGSSRTAKSKTTQSKPTNSAAQKSASTTATTSAKPAEEAEGAVSKEDLRRAFEAKYAREKQENAAKSAPATPAAPKKDTGTSPVDSGVVHKVPLYVGSADLAKVLSHLTPAQIIDCVKESNNGAQVIGEIVGFAINETPGAVIQEHGATLLSKALLSDETRSTLIETIWKDPKAAESILDIIAADDDLVKKISE